MTPAARLSAAIEILEAIDAADTAADSIIRAYFRPRRYAGSKDRRSVGNRVFDVIRHRTRLDWWIAGAAGDMQPSARLRVLASILLLDGETSPGVHSLFDGTAHSPSPLGADEQQLVENLAAKPLLHDAMPQGVVHEVPEWLDKPFQSLWDERYAAEMTALNDAAPVDIRVNLGRVSRGQAQKSLSIDHIKTTTAALSPAGLRLVERARLEETRAFKKGLIEVQDEGSQLIALLCEAKPGMTVIDYCAGGGGKTLALADAMGMQGGASGEGQLIACDVSTKRLSGLEERVKRAGATTIQQLVLDDEAAVAKLKDKADRVLIDAPCSGIGAWRRHPEARWRLTQARLDRHVADQQKILNAAAKMVKPGGRLIYATCSLLTEENEAQVEAFLGQHDDFTALPITDIWVKTIPGPCPSATSGLRLSPADTDTDGFFCAVMERKSI
ncbi:MAG: RsmB/NOP family class I SAM-dependent RNA methyltransferase [Rhodospirillaceae bacterium]|jgi:16S rRNA (cytosine967-C5)-methyltransferase|nr:RsmB/NOP family class I SAM-dependent RNA methyltransferase [Rhodospirillaceae bacterium]MBT5244537.1 RsmB/NOP family class I SAM-dependent RNA methyltransferase [Rhodospirillaceae bacterium]MBT5562867.1 RsmB/NOP family class I SAM-dependent RNA methyltransferase [Rhodospirillaceae bacterium]MBT6242493.1 RsmB/NOP family class I SAM-dependent RNA methyltransferase [Rhodospirillaceae bacterium]MBT7137965.1 RsmB/NOP family class I SAM-dependent RNA methyltransferase [Rhodospirillaceae bacterium